MVPLTGLAVLLAGWTLAHGGGWLPAAAAVAGWSAVVVVWLRRRGGSAAGAHLIGWAVPAALLAPLGGLGWLSADGLVLWGPVSAVLAVALAATHAPGPGQLPGAGAPHPMTRTSEMRNRTVPLADALRSDARLVHRRPHLRTARISGRHRAVQEQP